MKRMFLIICLLLLISGSAYAAPRRVAIGGESGVTMDAMLSLGTNPGAAHGATGSFGAAIGFGAGATFDISSALNVPNLAFRADLNYYKWTLQEVFYTFKDVEWSFTRVPLFLGARYFVPLKGGSRANVYFDGGLEISFDSWEFPWYEYYIAGYDAFGFPVYSYRLTKTTISDTSAGITPGIGVELPIGKSGVFGGNARYHIVDGSYLTIGATVGIRF